MYTHAAPSTVSPEFHEYTLTHQNLPHVSLATDPSPLPQAPIHASAWTTEELLFYLG